MPKRKKFFEALQDHRVETVKKFFQSCDTGNVPVIVMGMPRAF